jgi:hypothetical protein
MNISDRHKPRAVIALLMLSALSLATSGCLEADTRGDEPPDEVVISGTPSWENGVGALMQLKCGACHQVPPGPLSPNSVPTDLDLNFQTAPAPGLRGAQDILPFIAGGILRGGYQDISQMPLEQATPLTEGEIQALEAWDGS